MKQKNERKREVEGQYGKYAEAVLFATERHQHQTRANGAPYITHPLRAADILRNLIGCQDVDILCAAVLHDTIEDTDTDWNDIAERFGNNVANWVAELTVDKRLPKVERGRVMLETAKSKSPEYRLIKLADRLDNISDMEGWSLAKRKKYAVSTEALLDVHRGTNETLEGLIAQKLKEL